MAEGSAVFIGGGEVLDSDGPTEFTCSGWRSESEQVGRGCGDVVTAKQEVSLPVCGKAGIGEV